MHRDREVDVDKLSACLRFENFLERDVNHNLSGGEIKRSELLQLMAQQPDMVLLDEPESGVDSGIHCTSGRKHQYRC